MESPGDEEAELIRGFILPARRKRMIELLSNPKRRREATRGLAHLRNLDPRWIVELSPSEQNARSVESSLRSHGAGDSCYVVSENRNLDGKRLPLLETLEDVIAMENGTLISCLPGRVAFFEGEGPSDRCLLVRRAP